MKKFWNWMEKFGEPFGDDWNYKEPTKQMLIGYMIQYLHEMKVVFSMSFNKQPMFSVEDAYDFLVLKINEEG